MQQDSNTGVNIAAPEGQARGGFERAFRVIAVTSGKGGVGKTNVVVNLAIQLAREGRRVLVFDADLGLSNCDIMMGVVARKDLRHLIYEGATFDECVVEGPEGVHLLSGGSGVAELAQLGDAERLRLLAAIEGASPRYDTILIDTGAGIGSNVLFFAGAAHEVVIVLAPEPTALADAYSTIKVLAKRSGIQRVLVCVNRVSSVTAAREAFGRLHALTSRFLNVVVELGGWIPVDVHVEAAVAAQVPVSVLHPMSPSAQRFKLLGDAISRRRPELASSGGFHMFWRSVLEGQGGSPPITAKSREVFA
ncbi:MAG: MinD/ParA family protein [Myxococcales bacterium]|nr:MinD/ParA family protein [Myxococcales bacterium]